MSRQALVDPLEGAWGNVSEAGVLGGEPAPDASAALMQLITGGMISQALSVAAKFGVADLLAAGPKDVSALAEAAGADAPSLYRVLRALASVGVFRERADGRFELTPTAEPLRTDAPGSLRDTAVYFEDGWHRAVWGDLYETVRTGETAFARVHGMDVFPFFAANVEIANTFDRAMTSLSNVATEAVIEAYDFAGVRRLVDVAGGHGRFLTGILHANSTMHGVLFDQPQVVEGARARIEAEGLAERCELAAGDFFESVPVGADAYAMKHIIHDWDDERSLVILKNIRRAMADDGRVLIVEPVLPEGNTPHYGKLLDLEMLLFTGGKERTTREYAELLDAAGLRLTRVVPTKTPLSVVEAVKA